MARSRSCTLVAAEIRLSASVVFGTYVCFSLHDVIANMQMAMNNKERLDAAFIIGQFFRKDSHYFSEINKYLTKNSFFTLFAYTSKFSTS